MNVNKNIYPDVTVLDNVTFTRKLTEVTDYTDYLEKSIFYCGCNNPYMSFVDTNSIKRTNTDGGLRHTFKKGETTKHDICMSISDYTGGMYGYFGEVHENGWHGAENTLINHFDVTKCYIDLDNLYINTISLEHANMTGQDAVYQNDTHQYTISEYLALENKPPIMSWSSIFVIGLDGANMYPLFCRKADFYNAYTPTAISYRSAIYNYISDVTSGGTSTNDKYYAVQTDWNNQGNTSILFYDSNGTPLSGSAVIGIPNDCEIFTPVGQGEIEYNYFIPVDYDYTDAPMPMLYYWSNWQTYYFNLYSWEYFLKMVASTGLRFKLNNVIYASEIDSNGYTTGRYIPVSELADSDFANKDWITSEDSTYDADKKPPEEDPNEKIDSMGMNNVLGNGGNFLNIYNCNHGAITQIATWLDSRELVTGYDPLSYNVALLEYPMDIGTFVVPKQSGAHILFGRYAHDESIPDPADSGATGDKIWDQVVIMDVGSFVLWKKFGDFRDYAPYTQCTIYIPFFGEIPIDVQLHAGKTISAKIAIDVGSGAAICCIFADNILISKVNATLANEVPLTSENWGLKRAALIQSITGLTTSLGAGVGVVSALATTSIAAPVVAATVAVAGGGNLVSNMSNGIATLRKDYSAISGSSGSRAEEAAPMRPFAKVTRVKSVIPDKYGHERGYVCDFTARLGDLIGLTKTNNVDTSGLSCTAEERVQVKQMLDSGVYL